MKSVDLDTAALSPALDTRMSTRELLVDLGFKAVVAEYADQQPGYQYDFGNFILEASQVTGKYFQSEIYFAGILSTAREHGTVEFSLPLYVESYEQGVALIAHNIGKRFIPIRVTPWLILGRMWEEHLPSRREMRLYAQRPQCHVEAEWFRVAVKKLMEHGSQANETQVFKVSFLSGVLKFELPSQNLVMPGTGKDWRDECICFSKGLVHLSKRTPSEGITLGVWKSHLSIGRLSLKIEPSPFLNAAIRNQPNTKVPWRPKGPVESGLVAVMIRPGDVTEEMWLHALSDRVTEMALAQPDPVAAVRTAAGKMGCMEPGSPRETGQYLVENNWQLHEYFTNEMMSSEGPAFPDKVEFGDAIALEAIQDTDLTMWVDMALVLCSSAGRD
jgi:hypothetical protein